MLRERRINCNMYFCYIYFNINTTTCISIHTFVLWPGWNTLCNEAKFLHKETQERLKGLVLIMPDKHLPLHHVTPLLPTKCIKTPLCIKIKRLVWTSTSAVCCHTKETFFLGILIVDLLKFKPLLYRISSRPICQVLLSTH